MQKQKIEKKLGEIISDETKQLAQNSHLNYDGDCWNSRVSDICDDSRKVSDGALFVAINGNAADGTKYISDAISRGTKYVVLECEKAAPRQPEPAANVTFIYTKNARRELAYIASRFFKKDLADVIAVTGTNGKSSTADIVRQIWTFARRNAVSIGTLGVIYGDGTTQKLAGTLTCPPAITLHKIFHGLSQKIADPSPKSTSKFSVALEASSHGIDQHRLDFIPFSVCAFTNFSQDHLDYHKSMEQYWKAKERLFSELANDSTKFVVNADDPKSEHIKAIAKSRKIACIDYGYNAGDIRIIETFAKESHQKITASFFGKTVSFSLPLFGKFQIYNALCAAGICYLTGVNIEDIIAALEKIRPINGRLELVACKCFGASETQKNAQIYVDYAHTPDALQNSILSLREHRPNRIVTLFGCGGNRDHDKRKIMGEIAAKFSDIVIVTDDNPREESPAEVRKMILEGCQKEADQAEVIEIGDRHKAIEYAIDMLQDGDALLIAGKGHETYQQIGTKFIHFDDKEVVLNKLAQKNKNNYEESKCE